MAYGKYTLTYSLFIIFALSTWLDLNGVWVELPLIVPHVPEGWSLPSYLSLAVAISNVGPLLIMLLKALMKDRLDERIFIYIEIVIGTLSCILMALYWNKTTWFAGSERSVLFTVFIFLLGTLDTTSTITYSDYMKRFDARLLNALFLGESLTSLIPSLLATIQGVGGEASCETNSTTPSYSSPRFSVEVFFFLFAIIILLSLAAFLVLEWSQVADDFRTNKFYSANSFSSIQYENEISTNSVHYSKSMSKSTFYGLLVVAYFTNVILFGILPSIGTYVMLPYSQRAYYLSSIILPISNPLSVFLSSVISIRMTLMKILIPCLIASVATSYVLLVALLSPCPPLHDTNEGAALVLVCYFLAQMLYYYVRILLANRIRKEYQHNSGLFWLGSVSQLGALSGSIPMYFLINTLKIFKSREPCRIYC